MTRLTPHNSSFVLKFGYEHDMEQHHVKNSRHNRHEHKFSCQDVFLYRFYIDAAISKHTSGNPKKCSLTFTKYFQGYSRSELNLQF